MAQLVKNLPVKQEIWVRFLDWEHPLGEGTATHSSILAMDYIVHGVANSWTWLSDFHLLGFPDSSVGKESACNTGNPGLIPGSGRSAGEEIDYPLQCSRAPLVAQLSSCYWFSGVFCRCWIEIFCFKYFYPAPTKNSWKSITKRQLNFKRQRHVDTSWKKIWSCQ